MPTIKGKYGDYDVTPEQYKSWEKSNLAKEHKSLIRSVKKEFPNLKVNGVKVNGKISALNKSKK